MVRRRNSDSAPDAGCCDLAAGTGKFTRLLEPIGADLLAVEPVAGMRATVPRACCPTCRSSAATAGGHAVPRTPRFDVVLVAQAWHWFDHDRAARRDAAHRPVRAAASVWSGTHATAVSRGSTESGRSWTAWRSAHRGATTSTGATRSGPCPGSAAARTAEFRHDQPLTPAQVVQRVRVGEPRRGAARCRTSGRARRGARGARRTTTRRAGATRRRVAVPRRLHRVPAAHDRAAAAAPVASSSSPAAARRSSARCEGPPGAPTLLLLHGWIASAGLNWFQVFDPLGRHFRIVAPGPARPRARPADAAHLPARRLRRRLRPRRIVELGTGPVIAVGYSMGGPDRPAAVAPAPRPRRRARALRDGARVRPRSTGAARLPVVDARLRRAWRGLPRARPPFPALACSAAGATRLPEWVGGRDAPARLAHDRRGRSVAVSTYYAGRWIGEVDVPTAVVCTTRRPCGATRPPAGDGGRDPRRDAHRRRRRSPRVRRDTASRRRCSAACQ